MSQKQQMTLEQYINTLRNNIILSYDSAKEQALKSVDSLTNKLVEQMQINKALTETKEKPIVEPKPEPKKRK